MKNIKYYFLLLAILTNAHAVNKTGTMAAKFLSTNIGSKAVGMGGAFTAISNDGSSMYWNPAGVGFHQLKSVFVNHSNWIADISFDYFRHDSCISREIGCLNHVEIRRDPACSCIEKGMRASLPY